MGKGSKFETGDRFCQTRGQKDRNQYGYPSEVVGEIEGVLGGEEKIRQEVIYKIAVSASPQRKFSKRCDAIVPSFSTLNAPRHRSLYPERAAVALSQARTDSLDGRESKAFLSNITPMRSTDLSAGNAATTDCPVIDPRFFGR